MRKPARFPERVEEDAGGWRAATGRSRERWRLRQGIDVAEPAIDLTISPGCGIIHIGDGCE
jgi:hypothetical protein